MRSGNSCCERITGEWLLVSGYYLVSVAENENRQCHPCESRGPERKTGFPLEFIPHTMRGGNPGAPGLFPQQELFNQLTKRHVPVFRVFYEFVLQDYSY